MRCRKRAFSSITFLVFCLHAAVSPVFGACGLQLFRRGDSNDDGKVDLSDGVTTLGFLFLGTTKLPCRDAADANDSGALDLTDAVYTFLYLFSGGSAIPLPGPMECGVDPSS